MSGLEPIRCRPPALPKVSSTPPILNIEHRVRVSVLEPEHLWKLRTDTLLIVTEGQADVAITLSSVTKLRLVFEPSRMQLNRYRCYLYNASGKIATIQNDHFKGIASFEDRSTTYVPFLHTLIPRIASLNPLCQFSTGVSMLRWLANLAIFSGVGVAILLIFILLYSAIGWLVVVKLVVIAFFIPIAIGWLRKNYPRPFDPTSIPKRLLPQ